MYVIVVKPKNKRGPWKTLIDVYPGGILKLKITSNVNDCSDLWRFMNIKICQDWVKSLNIRYPRLIFKRRWFL